MTRIDRYRREVVGNLGVVIPLIKGSAKVLGKKGIDEKLFQYTLEKIAAELSIVALTIDCKVVNENKK
jgi:hypothetical protein